MINDSPAILSSSFYFSYFNFSITSSWIFYIAFEFYNSFKLSCSIF